MARCSGQYPFARRHRAGAPSTGRRHGTAERTAKAGLAKKLIDEARKPQNQQKAKDLLAQVRAKRGR